MSRSCFEVWKNVPNGDGTFTQRKGRYYFLEPGCTFEPHSQLGGHWFEGHPFQTGAWATLETPKPVWVNGSTVFPLGWPEVHGCCGMIEDFTPTRAWISVTIPGRGVHTAWAYLTAFSLGTYFAYWEPTIFGNRYSCFLKLSPCGVTLASYPCNFAGSPGEIFPEEGMPDDYQVSAAFSGITLSETVTGLCFAGCSALVRYYGTPLP